MTQQPENQGGLIPAQLLSLPIPVYYFNSFANNMTATEITTTCFFGPRPLVNIIMSLSMAKSYAKEIQDLIARFENDTGATVPLVQDIMARIKE